MEAEPLVEVEVLVNVEGLRRGWRGQVELSPRIEMLVGRGYLRITGHADASPVALPVAPGPTPISVPESAPRRSRAKGKATTTPPEGSGGDSAGNA